MKTNWRIILIAVVVVAAIVGQVALTIWPGLPNPFKWSSAVALASPQQDWIEKIGPAAQRIVTPTCGFPSVTIAQSAQESGWGTSFLATEANNPFGRKCGFSPCIQIMTPEYRNGVRQLEPHWFQVYESLEDALIDYCDKIAKPWYRRDFSSPYAFVDSIASPYATDPNYAKSVKSIIRTYRLEVWDAR